jgi:hypothetical protein
MEYEYFSTQSDDGTPHTSSEDQNVKLPTYIYQY